jgi:hypothetical protein
VPGGRAPLKAVHGCIGHGSFALWSWGPGEAPLPHFNFRTTPAPQLPLTMPTHMAPKPGLARG